MTKPKLLIVITGATAVGKTTISTQLAKQLETEIISCDSRQFYKEMQIGTAAPTEEELALVPHHFIRFLSVTEPYDVFRFEADALACLENLFQQKQFAIMTGGSGLYIDAVCRGFDELPDRDPELRMKLQQEYKKYGLEYLQEQVKKLDPEYFSKVDINNPNRLLRAIEVCIITGKTFSQLRKGKPQERPFRILKLVLNRERKELFDRIALRTDKMIADGMVDEVKSLIPYRHFNALKTVGYKEIFEYLDGKISLSQAIEDIKTNTRRYAKRQLTWFKKDVEYKWFHPDETNEIMELIKMQFN
ncbi:MAG: tRNA (adenosine(37)-N6)-dimethylallyltransferase MiaA [Bacteroidales bacterium]|nr:tRNA (adenosine(37)-N6)-dimethylallyltransferase MiaA [Bacteroidales bacterium]